jgi:four helix bundle protein
MKFERFEDIPVWRETYELSKRIHKITTSGSFGKDYGLRDQIRRSVISVSSNIAEGFERNNNREFIRYLYIAKASAAEARSQIHLALAFGHINQEMERDIVNRLTKISSSIGGFIDYLKTFIKTGTKSPNPNQR